MKIFTSIKSIKQNIKQIKQTNKTIALVPTMGALHEGHFELGKKALETADYVIYSIFLNPKQFAPGEDLDKYPKNFKKDQEHLQDMGVHAIFYPSVEEMYPKNFQTTINISEISKYLCGISRPSHFQGVATVVCKLFNITNADIAFFGKKDYQQIMIIKQMVKDLNINIEIKDIEIVREYDGLARSSRNAYLSPQQREKATILYRALQKAKKDSLIVSDRKILENIIYDYISQEKLVDKIEYVEIRNRESLKQEDKIIHGTQVIFLAVVFGNTRLIDNMEI